jgi:hypothetical protein
MTYMMDHSSNPRPVCQGDGLIESLESKALDGLLLVGRSSDNTPPPRDRDRLFYWIEPFSSPLPSHVFFPKPPQEPSIG